MPIPWERVTVTAVRLWTITLLAVVLVVYGLVNGNTESLFLGFAVLGGEPIAQARP